jgi:hypothetical protein
VDMTVLLVLRLLTFGLATAGVLGGAVVPLELFSDNASKLAVRGVTVFVDVGESTKEWGDTRAVGDSTIGSATPFPSMEPAIAGEVAERAWITSDFRDLFDGCRRTEGSSSENPDGLELTLFCTDSRRFPVEEE